MPRASRSRLHQLPIKSQQFQLDSINPVKVMDGRLPGLEVMDSIDPCIA